MKDGARVSDDLKPAKASAGQVSRRATPSRTNRVGRLTRIRRHDTDIHVTTRDGTRLAVREYGPRSAGRTVVPLHGWCLSKAMWARQISYLRRRYGDDIRILSYDHRGHGRSDSAPTNTYRVDQLATDLADVLTALEVGGATTLVGHSMGGMTALAYLGLDARVRPVDPDGLVLVATSAGKLCEHGLGRLLATPATNALMGIADRTPAYALKTLAGPILAILAGLGADRTQRATLLALTAAALATTPLTTAVGFLPALRDYEQHHVLSSIRARTIVISGGADLLTPPAHSLELAASIPGATHIHLPKAGHMLPQEACHVINDAIRRAMPAISQHRLTVSG